MFSWTPIQEHVSVGQPAKTSVDTRESLEDLLGVMNSEKESQGTLV